MAEAAAAKRLRIGILTRVPTLNPREARDHLSSMVAAQIFETPFRPPQIGGAAEPLLFDGPLESRSEGGATVLAGGVRAGLAFSDGTPVTAALVAQSLARVEALRSQAEISAEADRVIFRLRVRNPRFELALTLPHCGVILEQGGQVLGSGPYRATTPAGGDEIRLTRNPHYRRPPDVEELVFQVHPADEDGRPRGLIAALEAGSVDFTSMLSRTDAAGLPSLRTAFSPAASTAILYMNTERPGLDQAAVRRAIAFAVDRLAVAQVSYPNPLAFAATSILPAMMGMAHDGLTYDLAKARGLLAAAGVRKPERLRLLPVWAPRPYLPNPRPVAELIGRQLGEIGIAVEIVAPGASEQFFARLESRDYDLVLCGWIADTPDPADFLESNLHSSRLTVGPASFNLSRYRNPAMDEALERFRAEPGPEHRNVILQILHDDVPLLPLMHGPNVVVHSRSVRGVVVSPLGIPYFEKFELAG